MAQTFPPAEIKVTANAQQAIAQFEKLNKELGTVEKQTVKASTAMKSMGNVASTFKSVLASIGVSASIGFAVKEFASLQASMQQLSVALSNVGLATQENMKATVESLKYYETLGFDAHNGAEALSILVTATGDYTQAQKYLGMAADVARFKSISLEEASRSLARANEGNAKAFKEFGITLDTTLPKAEAVEKAMGELSQKTGGQAVAFTKTFAGQMAILQVEVQDVAEKIGGVLVPKILLLINGFKALVDYINNNQAVFAAVAVFFGTIMVVALTNMARSAWTAVAAMIGLDAATLAIPLALAGLAAAFVYAWNNFEKFREVIVRGVQGILNVFAFFLRAVGFIGEAFLQVATGPIRLFLKALGFIYPEAKTLSAELDKAPKAFGDWFDKAADKVNDFSNGISGLANKKINLKFSLPDVLKLPNVANGQPLIPGLDPETLSKANEINKKLGELYDKRAKVVADGEEKLARIRNDYADKQADIQKQYAKDVASAQKDAAKRTLDIVKQSVDALREVFKSSVSRTIGDLYDALTFSGRYAKGGNITNLTSGLAKQLSKAKQLAENAASLAGLGFSQAFIQEVVAQGPDVGNKLAETIKGATPDQIKELQKTWEDLNKTSNHGVDALAEKLNSGMNLVTEELKAQLTQVQTDLDETLASLALDLADNLANAFKDFTQKIQDAQKSIADSLAEINKDIANTLSELAKLGIARAQASTYVPPSTGKPSGGTTIVDNSKKVTVNTQTQTTAQQIASATAWAIRTSSDGVYAINPKTSKPMSVTR